MSEASPEPGPVRRSRFAGTWYPASPGELSALGGGEGDPVVERGIGPARDED